MKGFDLSPVARLMVRERWAETPGEADISVDALVQWLAGHAAVNHQIPYVMMHGPVDKAFHALVLHTRLYRRFCHEHVGFFINHTPLDAEQADEFRIMGGIEYTVNFLATEFGPQLARPLVEWKEAYLRGQLTISAVSCVSNDLEGVEAHLPQKEAYWERLEAFQKSIA